MSIDKEVLASIKKDGFHVKCDKENNTPEDQAEGRIIAEVIMPLKPNDNYVKEFWIRWKHDNDPEYLGPTAENIEKAFEMFCHYVIPASTHGIMVALSRAPQEGPLLTMAKRAIKKIISKRPLGAVIGGSEYARDLIKRFIGE
jgi:hypothetical protein